MQLSERGAAFIAAHEGFVSRPYRDPAGILTIGYGFTMRSRVLAEFWTASRGGPLKEGDTISESEARGLLRRLVQEEYGPQVFDALHPAAQHHFDAACSVTYNCGATTLRDRWAKAFSTGNVAEAARLLRNTRTTAGGRFIAGLARRRADEAELLERGDYGLLPAARATSDLKADIKAYQTSLATLGFYRGPLDGIAGPATIAAVVAFQKTQHLLKPDGIVGPATSAALRRAVEERAARVAIPTVGAAVAAAISSSGIPLPAIAALGACALLTLVFVAWRRRGLFFPTLPSKDKP